MALVGRNEFKTWPTADRCPIWHPAGGWEGQADRFQRFNLYYSAMCPHVFLFHVLGKALTYEACSIRGVNAERPFPEFYAGFVASVGGLAPVAVGDPEGLLQAHQEHLAPNTSRDSLALCVPLKDSPRSEVRRFLIVVRGGVPRRRFNARRLLVFRPAAQVLLRPATPVLLPRRTRRGLRAVRRRRRVRMDRRVRGGLSRPGMPLPDLAVQSPSSRPWLKSGTLLSSRRGRRARRNSVAASRQVQGRGKSEFHFDRAVG